MVKLDKHVSNPNLIVFKDGVNLNRVYAHRGDIFTCEGVFKSEKKVDREDHILCKPNRPVLVVSDDEYNKTIVKVLPLSTSSGSSDPDSCTNSRCIQIPSVDKREGSTYIDVSQEFTVNVHQLRYKMASVSQEIVDTAVALNLLQKVNKKSINRIVNILKDNYPNSECFDVKVTSSSMDMIDARMAPYTDIFAPVEQVKEKKNEPRKEYPPHGTYDEADSIYNEWVKLGTDAFCYKYQLNRNQYMYLRGKCMKLLLGKKNGFTKFDWRG